MKKSLIALAVAATAAVGATPMIASSATLQAAAEDQSNINLYGSLRPQWETSGDNKIGDGGSRFGIKGSHDLGNGQKSFYRIEQKISTVNADFGGGRLAYAGLGGGWGDLAFGQQWTPYYTTVASPSDIFAGNGLDNYNTTGGVFRAGNALTYALPKGMVIGGAFMGIVNGDVTDADGNVKDNQDDIDAYSLGLTANAGPVVLGFGYHDKSEQDESRIGFSASGNFGPVFAAFMMEGAERKVDGDLEFSDTTPWAITGQWMGIALQYSDRDLDVDSAAWTLGYTYKLSGNTRVQFSYENDDMVEDDKFVARYRVDF